MQREHRMIINLITLHFHLVNSLVLMLPAAESDFSFLVKLCSVGAEVLERKQQTTWQPWGQQMFCKSWIYF